MRRIVTAITAVLFVGCAGQVRNPAPAQPVRLTSSRPPQEVVQRAAQRLAEDGFVVSLSDASGGLVTASVSGSPNALARVVTCGYPKSAAANTMFTVRLTMSVTARAAAAGSEVSIIPRTQVAPPSGAGIYAAGTTDEQCASSGAVEAAIAAAVK